MRFPSLRFKRPLCSSPETTLLDGGPVTDNHRDINPDTGMQQSYVVLSETERAKGFVRPVRTSYSHVGVPEPRFTVRKLTDEEKQQPGKSSFDYYEEYPESEAPALGRYYTEKQLAGCGSVTEMAVSLAETYARDPSFYGGTFCSNCGAHYPVGAGGEFVWADGSGERVGT